MTKPASEECAYCYREVPVRDPREMDAGDWLAEERRHAPGCEWVATRAHTKMTCTGPECSRPTVARGLCASHYRQQQRGREITPLRSGPSRVAVTVRVSEPAAAAVRRDRAGARTALEIWARR